MMVLCPQDWLMSEKDIYTLYTSSPSHYFYAGTISCNETKTKGCRSKEEVEAMMNDLTIELNFYQKKEGEGIKLFYFPTLNNNIDVHKRSIFNFQWNIEKNDTSRYNVFSMKQKEYFNVIPIGGISDFP